MQRLKVIPLLLTLAISGLESSGQWTRFRGPNGSGVVEGSGLPVDIGPAKSVVWKTALPPGHSSPVLAGDHIFLTAAEGGKPAPASRQKIVHEGGKLFTICLDRRTGKILWKREAPRPRLEEFQPTNSPASPSPVTDGQSVFVFFGDYGLLAYGVDGEERWRVPLGPFQNTNGHGSSPVLFEDLLVMLCDQDANSYLLAVDKKTGRVRWKVERPEATRSYSTPVVAKGSNGVAELIVPGSYQLTSYSAKTGEKLWWIGGLSWQPKSTPVVDGDVVYAHWWENGGEAEQPAETPAFEEVLVQFDSDKDRKLTAAEFASDPRMQKGFENNDLAGDGFLDQRDWDFYRARRASRNALLAVRTGGRGDLTSSERILWRMQKFLPNVPSPLLYQGVMYLIKDGGILTAIDAKTGQITKQGRLPGALGTYYSSPVGAGGHVYLISQSGIMTVVTAGREWEVAATNDFGEECFATPAIADGAIYVRTRGTLYCFRISTQV